MARVLGKLLRGLGYLLLTLCAVVAFLSLPKGVIEWRFVGQFIVAFVGGPILAILIAGTILAFWRWHRRRERLALAMTVVALSGAVACSITLASHMSAARTNGISIDLVRVFWPGPMIYPAPPSRTYVYDRFGGEDVNLVVYRPASRADGKKAPLLVYVHGGGWVMGDANGRRADMQWFAQQGYVVISVTYSLSSPTRHLWDVTQPQIGCALAWIGKNAGRLGGDPARIALFGESAGGNLVLNTSGLAHRGALPSRCGGEVPDIAATISIYPPVDLAKLYSHEPARRFGIAYLGGSPRQFPSRYAAVSPSIHVREPAPPVLILTGLEDSLVPVVDTLRYVETARAAGRKVELITVRRAGHGFDAIPGSIGNQIVRKATISFLKREGLAP